MAELNLLLVDDEPEISSLMEFMLKKQAPQFNILSAESGRQALDLLENDNIDCVLSDYQMPGMNGLELLKELRGMGHDVPFIFVTGQGNEEIASEAFKDGANDYFTKEIGFAHFPRIINSVEQAVRQRKAKAAEEMYQAELIEYNKRLESAELEWEETFNAIKDPVTIHDRNFKIIQINAAAASALGMDADDMIGRKCYELFHHRNSPISNCPAVDVVTGMAAINTHEVDVNGRDFEVSVYPLVRDGGMRGFVHVAKDITETKLAERAKTRARQVMETIYQTVRFGMVVVGRDKTIRRVNRAALKMLGYENDAELVGTMCYDNICTAGKDKCPVLDLGQEVDHSIRTMRDKSGSQKKIVKSVIPMTMDEEEVLLETFMELKGDLGTLKAA